MPSMGSFKEPGRHKPAPGRQSWAPVTEEEAYHERPGRDQADADGAFGQGD